MQYWLSSKVRLVFYILLLLISIIFFSCSGKSPTNPKPRIEEGPRLELISNVKLKIDEPSGLCFSLDNKTLWTVSDETGKVYKISTSGQTIETLSYTNNNGLEGIALDRRDSTLWVADEYLSEIINLDTLGNVLRRIKIVGASGESGLEGITINTTDNHFFLLKEKKPGVLIELDESFNLLRYKQINFAFDFSGIFYEGENQHLWIVSDQSKKIYKCDLNASVLTEYPIDVVKAEGIAVDIEKMIIYIVSDAYEELYIFSIKE